MKALIIDASVALKWLSGENETEVRLARQLYRQLKAGTLAVYAPTFLLIEVVNILLKKKKFTPAEVEDFITVLLNSGINFIDFNYLKINDLLGLTAKYKVTSYDGLYLLAAFELGCQLISEDKELLVISETVVSLNFVGEKGN